MQKIIVNVPEDLHTALVRHREQTGVPVSEYIRRTLRLSLFADEPKIEKRQQQPIERRTTQPVLIAGEAR